jgi:deoxyribose-phosphate aldolase
VGIKAAGGIRNLSTMLSLIEAGATRIGSSKGVDIMKELIKEQSPESGK